ncbi:MAG: right-handed parallel beta-helix repeat-containing protein [Planctomycetes bacterium]|nr:right-handed parallel beta-helix repeat-containing protein [Planctomycetota bacterium]
MRFVTPFVGWLAAAVAAIAQAPAPQPPIAEPPTLVVDRDLQLEAGKVYGALLITAANVRIEGNGARILGPGARGGACSGIGVLARGVTGVHLEGLVVKGFETGLVIEGGEGHTVADCDFSDNFVDPDFGWGEQPARGGLVLRGVARATLRAVTAQRVQDGCNLIDSDHVVIERCTFSHCSNVCLKLWHACDNRVEHSDLSYGLRISPGEVHARDSTCVLLESGSDRNHFAHLDCTHGGDGVFLRVLNNWPSVDNVFDHVDASWANNNAFEAWSARNTYRHCKANHSSYGFWLGASDQTVLIGNEAGWNGRADGFHNAPEAFGNGGIVFACGPSSHTLVQDNWCHDNGGPGIVLRGDVASRGARFVAHHWVIQQNRLEHNHCGVFAEFADWIWLGPNTFTDNRDGDVCERDGVTRLVRLATNVQAKAPPTAVLTAPAGAFVVGREVVFDAGRSADPEGLPITWHWDLGDGTRVAAARVAHTFALPGFYRVGLTVENGSLAALAWRDVYVVDDLDTAGDAAAWTWTDTTGRCKVVFVADPEQRLVGESALRAEVDPYDGDRVSLQFPRQGGLAHTPRDGEQLVFWLRARNPGIPAWQDVNPLVTLHQDAGRRVVLRPERDLLSQPVANETRDGWNRFAVPLQGGQGWVREGEALTQVQWITLGFDSWGAPPLTIWIDGLGFR